MPKHDEDERMVSRMSGLQELHHLRDSEGSAQTTVVANDRGDIRVQSSVRCSRVVGSVTRSHSRSSVITRRTGARVDYERG
jgi:hypothetical protein